MSSYHHQSNDQVEPCIAFIKCTIKIYIDNNQDINLALSQICSTPVEAGLLSLAVMLFNGPIRDLLPKMNRVPSNIHINDVQYEALKPHHNIYIIRTSIFKNSFCLFCWIYSSSPVGRWGVVDLWSHSRAQWD